MKRTFLILFSWIIGGCGTKNVYEICVIKNAENGRVIYFENIGKADTSVASISGMVSDKIEPLDGALVEFRNKSTNQAFAATTKLDGSYQTYLPSGNYEISFRYLGYGELTIENSTFKTGQIQKINVSLGPSMGFVTYKVKSKKPLSKEEQDMLFKKLSNKEK